MRHFSKVLLCTLFSLFVIQKLSAQFTAINNGNWNTPATWQGGVVPTTGADVIIAATVNISHADVTVGDFTINTGGTINSNYPYGVKLNSGKTFTNNGTVGNVFHVTFLGSGLVAGSATSNFTVVNIEGPVDFGTTSTVANLTINPGGSVNTNRPTYRIGSSLNYNTGGTYVIGDEWVTGNTNYPRALTINAGTTLSFGNITTSRRVGGVNDAMNINGGMILSSAAGGDLIITSTYNNFNGTFTANGRTVTCLDGGSNCIIGGSQPVSFDNLVLNLPGKQFNLFTPVTVTTSATFTAGYTVINNSDFIVNSGVTITGASANCYAYTNGAGRLVMKGVGAGPVVAPIGRNIGNVFIHYNPVTITNGGGFDYAIKANATAPTGAGILNTTKVIRCQWDITPSGNPTNVDLKFQYITGQGVSGGTFSETAPQRGLRYNTGTSAWETIGTATPVGTNPYNVSYPFSGPTWGLFSFESVTPPPPPPTITSFTPTSGIAGSTVTITGTNFNTTAANNIVYFGAVRSATPSSVTATSLTVTVPLGAAYAPITVLNTANGLQAHSKTYFNPTHSSTKATIVEADFVKTNVSSGTPNIWSMPCERADLDLDGDIDLIMNNYNSTPAGLLVFPNTSSVGSIAIGSSIGYPVLAPVRGLVTADIDGDGKQDIIGVGDYNSVSVWRNTSTSSISFAPRVDISMANSGNDIAVGDIDGDGKLDLAVTNNWAAKISIFRNTSTSGTISFAPNVEFTAPTSVWGVKIGDINGDGKNDVVTANVNVPANFSIYRNTGTTTGTVSLATRVDFANGTTAGKWVELGDIDMDGNLDLVISNNEWIVSVFRNTSSGNTMSFATPVSSNYGWVVDRINIGDLNGDTKPDIIIPRGGMVAILTNNSTSGNIVLSGQFDMGASSGGGMASIEVVDLDRDGKLDMFNGSDNTKIDFYRYSPPPPPPPTITSFTPTSGPVGTTVTITGTNFNTTAANNIVFFGATKATVTAATATSLTVTVPVGATFGNITEVNMGTSLLAHSNANFTPTFTPNKNSIAATDFDPKIEIATGTGTTWPYQVALGDVDGDGKADLVVANRAANNVAVFRNTSTAGTVSFATRVDFSTAQEARGLVLVDLDGDGKLDIATTGGNLNQVAFTVLRNTSTSGNISFATKIEINTTAATYSIASADIDGNGKADLIFGGQKMIIYPNTSTVGNITFAAPVDYTAAVNVNAIAVGDIDGDGKKDICFTAGSNVSVFRNMSTIGAISLASKVDFAAPSAYGITIGDWDGDGKLDIAASLLNTTNSMSILTNTSTVGNISFATRIDNSSPQNPYFVAGGDLNGDGKADLVTTNAGQNGTAANLSVYRNTSTSGAASFASNVNLALGSWPYYAAIGDIDGDGRPDIVSSSVEANRVAIFRNNPQFQTVVATSTLTAFAGCSGSASASQSFTVSGSALTANLVVTAPTGYEVSTTAGSGYASSVTLTPASGMVASTTIFVRLAATATGSPSGNITVASTGATTQSVAVSGTVNALPTATITAGGPTTFCQGGSVTLTASAGSSYLWSNGATTQSTTVSASGSYTVQVTYSAGCFATSVATVVTVNILPTPTITAGGATTFCQGGSVTLTASAGSSYLWSNGATTQAITVSAAGNYNVRVTNANGCFATSANTTVTVNPLPTATITAGGPTTFCQGGSVALTSNAGSSYLWSNNATTQSITATTSGNYTVTVTNASGCSTTSAVRTVTVNPLPVLTVTATPTSVSRGFNTQLNVTGSNLGTFAWTPTANLSSTTIANPIARVMSTTTYTVTVASSAGCTATGNVTVTALDDLNITSTNVFTPNGDGINDKFVIKNLDAYPNNKLQVMDRTGKVIYEKLNYANDWNGTVNGKLLAKDTYFFILIVNGQVLKKGAVTLVR